MFSTPFDSLVFWFVFEPPPRPNRPRKASKWATPEISKVSQCTKLWEKNFTPFPHGKLVNHSLCYWSNSAPATNRAPSPKTLMGCAGRSENAPLNLWKNTYAIHVFGDVNESLWCHDIFLKTISNNWYIPSNIHTF